MARHRDYRAEYAARQARARSAGFSSYYAQRVRGGSGATPDTPAPTPEQRRTRSGHAGVAALLRETKPESTIRVSTNLRKIESNDAGRWDAIPLTVTSPDGTEREYLLRNFWPEDIDWLVDELADIDVDFEEDYDLQALGG